MRLKVLLLMPALLLAFSARGLAEHDRHKAFHRFESARHRDFHHDQNLKHRLFHRFDLSPREHRLLHRELRREHRDLHRRERFRHRRFHRFQSHPFQSHHGSIRGDDFGFRPSFRRDFFDRSRCPGF